MRKRWILTFVLASALGSALHFLYVWLPLPAVGLFAPINESVWEHLKLLFWPFLLSAIYLTRSAPDPQAAWSGFLAAALVQPILVVAGFYTLRGALGVETLGTDIALYLLAMAAGYGLAARLGPATKRALGLLIILTAIYAAALVVFSLAAPNLPIFQSK